MNATSTPCPRAAALPATATAFSRLSGPSDDSAVAGRIAAVITTGFAVFTVRCSRYAVSSSVSVPCVITMPSIASLAASALIRSTSVVHSATDRSLLSMLAICSASIVAICASAGTAASSLSTPSAPA